MPTFRVVLKIPAMLYAYYDVEAASHNELEAELAQQSNANDLVAYESGKEFAEPLENAAWQLDEIGAETVPPITDSPNWKTKIIPNNTPGGF